MLNSVRGFSLANRQPAARVTALRAALTRMLFVEVSLGNTTNGDTAAAQRHHLGPALAGPFSRGAVAGDCRYQPAPRGHDDVRHRRRIHKVDVLGNCVSDTA